MEKFDLVIIGGGPAGLAAAQAAAAGGLSRIVVLERSAELGGILPQCIHNGFGLVRFKEDLTGPEYARRYIDMIPGTDIEVLLETMVLDVKEDWTITAVNPSLGLFELSAGAVVLAMGCREKTRGAIGIPGSRPAGIFTAGTAQRFINIHGYMPGRKAVILGSGDVGMIMARRMALEGAEVSAVLEIRPYLTGLLRNKVQCLDDFGIPLKLNCTITRIHGKERIEAVTTSKVDDNGNVIPGTDEVVECDTVLTSVGLIPENELSTGAGMELDQNTGGPSVDQHLQCSIPGFFACGNVLLVNDIVDDVSKQGEFAGQSAVHFVNGTLPAPGQAEITFVRGNNVQSIVPQKLAVPISAENIPLYIRVQHPERNVELQLTLKDEVLSKKKFERVAPGEMVKVKLQEKQIEMLSDESAELLVEFKMIDEEKRK